MHRVFFALVTGLIICTPAHAELFTNPVLGLSIEKPADWHIVTAEANAENLKKAEIGSPEFQEAVRKYASVPLYAFSRYPEPHPDMNASVKVNTRPSGSFAGRTGQDVIRALLPGLQRAMGDLKIITAPEPTMLGGKAAGHISMTYTLKAGGSSFPAASELWVIPRGDYLIVVGAGYRPDEKTGDREAVLQIVNSLKLRN